MTLALVAVAGEAAASLLEPWPLKIVLDYLLQARPLPDWMMPLVEWIGSGKLAVLGGFYAELHGIQLGEPVMQ